LKLSVARSWKRTDQAAVDLSRSKITIGLQAVRRSPRDMCGDIAHAAMGSRGRSGWRRPQFTRALVSVSSSPRSAGPGTA
jgi:hypothetical protein